MTGTSQIDKLGIASEKNNTLRDYLSKYIRPNLSVGERDYDFASGLVDLLNSIPESCYVQLSLDLSMKSTGLEKELIKRLLRAGAIKAAQTETTLCYRSSRISPDAGDVVNTSTSREAAFSGKSRRVFRYQTYPDFLSDSYEETLSQAVIEVNPSGLFGAGFRYELHNILPYIIKGIAVGIFPIPLTPMYDTEDRVPVKTENFWK